MKVNKFALVWYRCIVRGSYTYSDCPETVKGEPVKEVVKQLLIENGYSNLITE